MPITSPLFDPFPHVVHGFGGRDTSAAAMANHHALGDLVLLHQVHGDVIHPVDAPPSKRPKGDGWITAAPQIGLGIKTADCGCVLFYADDTRRIGAVHSGWPGVYQNIVERCVASMTRNPAHLYAVLGPCIRQESYQVDDAFRQRFLDRYPAADVFFQIDDTRENRFLFDMAGMIMGQLRGAGVVHVHDLGINTYTHPDFYSHRRATHAGTADAEGRQISFIALTS
jgi:YfiH family protein